MERILFLIWIFLGIYFHLANGQILVSTLPHVEGAPLMSVDMPCHFLSPGVRQGDVITAFWYEIIPPLHPQHPMQEVKLATAQYIAGQNVAISYNTDKAIMGKYHVLTKTNGTHINVNLRMHQVQCTGQDTFECRVAGTIGNGASRTSIILKAAPSIPTIDIATCPHVTSTTTDVISLTCHATLGIPPGELRWYYVAPNEIPDGVGRQIPATTYDARAPVGGCLTEATSTVNLTVALANNGGTLKCFAIEPNGDPFYSDKLVEHTLYLGAPPEQPTITNLELQQPSSNALHASCTGYAGEPPGELHWYYQPHMNGLNSTAVLINPSTYYVSPSRSDCRTQVSTSAVLQIGDTVSPGELKCVAIAPGAQAVFADKVATAGIYKREYLWTPETISGTKTRTVEITCAFTVSDIANGTVRAVWSRRNTSTSEINQIYGSLEMTETGSDVFDHIVDDRFVVYHVDNGSVVYFMLAINDVQCDDDVVYECRVTGPEGYDRRQTQLYVIAEPGQPVIEEGPTILVNYTDCIVLHCRGLIAHPNGEIHWLLTQKPQYNNLKHINGSQQLVPISYTTSQTPGECQATVETIVVIKAVHENAGAVVSCAATSTLGETGNVSYTASTNINIGGRNLFGSIFSLSRNAAPNMFVPAFLQILVMVTVAMLTSLLLITDITITKQTPHR